MRLLKTKILLGMFFEIEAAMRMLCFEFIEGRQAAAEPAEAHGSLTESGGILYIRSQKILCRNFS